MRILLGDKQGRARMSVLAIEQQGRALGLEKAFAKSEKQRTNVRIFTKRSNIGRYGLRIGSKW